MFCVKEILTAMQYAIQDSPQSVKSFRMYLFFLSLKRRTAVIFWSVLIINHLGYFENRIPLKPVLGGVCSLANYSVAYEETQSN